MAYSGRHAVLRDSFSVQTDEGTLRDNEFHGLGIFYKPHTPPREAKGLSGGSSGL